MSRLFDEGIAPTLRWLYIALGVVFVLCGLGFYYASISVESYKHDNPIEELVESGIEKATGIKIDVSPDSPEPQP
jgi:hypothetical protein